MLSSPKPLDHVSTKHVSLFVDNVMRQFAVRARVVGDGAGDWVTVPDEGRTQSDQESAAPSQLEILRSVIAQIVFFCKRATDIRW